MELSLSGSGLPQQCMWKRQTPINRCNDGNYFSFYCPLPSLAISKILPSPQGVDVVIGSNPHLERIKGFNSWIALIHLDPLPTPTPSRIPIGSSRHGAESGWSLAGSGGSHNCCTCTYIAVSRYGLAEVSAEGKTYAQVWHSLKEGDRTGERAREASS